MVSCDDVCKKLNVQIEFITLRTIQMKGHAIILHPKRSWSKSCYADFKTPNGCWVMLSYDPSQHSKIKILAIRSILK